MKTYLEFFAGVGLVREGLSLDGWECLWANDISVDKRDTYIQNFGEEDFALADIWDVVKDSNNLPDAFLYTASFPCTDLSVAGNRAGLAGKESGTINALFDILDTKARQGVKPKIVMLENVKGFLTSHKGEDCANTVRLFSELGYHVDIIELDASYFTPQSRQRVFMIAVDTQLAQETMLIKGNTDILDTWWNYFNQHPALRSRNIEKIILKNPELNWGLFDINFDREVYNNLHLIIDETVEDDSKDWWIEQRKDHLYNQMNESHQQKLLEMQNQQEYSYGTVFRRMRNGKSMAEFRTDGIAGCLRTPRGGSSKQILIRTGFGEWSVRLLNPREYARLQGVRDSFILPSNMNKGFFAMGDAVCVPAIEFLSNNILSVVYETWRN